MDGELQEIISVEGVGGAFVCDNAGEVIASSTPAVLATVTMNHIGRVAAQVFGAMEAANRRVERIEFAYDEWRLFARDLGLASLLVVCHPTADMAWLRMTVDVAVVGWKKNNAIEKKLGNRQPARHHLLKRENLDEPAWQAIRLMTGA